MANETRHYYVFSSTSKYSMELLSFLDRYINTAIYSVDADDPEFRSRVENCGFELSAPAIISVDVATGKRMVYMHEELEQWLVEFGKYQESMLIAKQAELNKQRTTSRHVMSAGGSKGASDPRRGRINVKEAAINAEKERTSLLNQYIGGSQPKLQKKVVIAEPGWEASSHAQQTIVEHRAPVNKSMSHPSGTVFTTSALSGR